MSTKDLAEIKEIVLEAVANGIKPLENSMGGMETRMDGLEKSMGGMETRIGSVEKKIDKVQEDISDLKLETKAIHLIIVTQSKDHEERIEQLEKNAGITPRS